MEFPNSGRGEIIYQKDTDSSLGEVALKLLVDFPEGGNFTCTEELSGGEALAYLKEEYDDAAGKYNKLANSLGIASSWGSLGPEQARRLWTLDNKSNPEAVAIIDEVIGNLNSLKGRMDEINNGVRLSLSSNANGEVPGGSAWLENIPCDFAGVEVSENNDGTYTAKIHVTEYKSDCTGYWADSIIYTITFTPDDEVLSITSEMVK